VCFRTSASDAPIFGAAEQESIQWNHHDVRPYAAITKAQLLGLLTALGEYTVRAEMTLPAMITKDPELAEKHRLLLEFPRRHAFIHQYRRAHVAGSLPNERHRKVPPFIADALPDEFVFNHDERAMLWNKYNNTFKDITKQELLYLLGALARYSIKAPRIEQVLGPMTGIVRMIHAHNALLSFADMPFTTDEFWESANAVLKGQSSRF
jgi:hypothetical protein